MVIRVYVQTQVTRIKLLVRKMTNNMPGYFAAKLPVVFSRELSCIIKIFSAGKADLVIIPGFGLIPGQFYVFFQLQLQRVVAKHICPSEVGFPPFEYWAEI